MSAAAWLESGDNHAHFLSLFAFLCRGVDKYSTMTDRTDEFRGAVKVFRPTVLPQKIDNAGTRGVAPHHFDQQQQQPPQQLAFFDEDGDGKDEAGALPRYAKPEASDFLQMAASVAVGFEGTAKLVSYLYTQIAAVEVVKNTDNTVTSIIINS